MRPKTYIVEGIKHTSVLLGDGETWWSASDVLCAFEVRADSEQHALWEAIQAHKEELIKADSLRVERKRGRA